APHRSAFLIVLVILTPPFSTPFPYPTLFRSGCCARRCSSGCYSIATTVRAPPSWSGGWAPPTGWTAMSPATSTRSRTSARPSIRSEEHTSELQSRGHLVCRLLLEKKKTQDPL